MHCVCVIVYINCAIGLMPFQITSSQLIETRVETSTKSTLACDWITHKHFC